MCRDENASKALVSATANPDVHWQRSNILLHGNEMEIVVIPEKDGLTDIEYLKEHVDAQTACVLIQHPNYYGNLEEAIEIGEDRSWSRCKICDECQSDFSWNYQDTGRVWSRCGSWRWTATGTFYCIRRTISWIYGSHRRMMRNLPGRIVGQTEDHNGKKGYVLDSSGKRAAYPSRKSIQQYLLKPGTLRTCSRRLSGNNGQ